MNIIIEVLAELISRVSYAFASILGCAIALLLCVITTVLVVLCTLLFGREIVREQIEKIIKELD